MRLKYTQVKEHRAHLLEHQGQQCALCGDIVPQEEAVLDHCHKTGKIRQVLHRGCNCLLGKIESNLVRNKVTLQRLNTFAGNLINYLQQEYADVVHPTYKPKETIMPGRGRGRGKKPPKR